MECLIDESHGTIGHDGMTPPRVLAAGPPSVGKWIRGRPRLINSVGRGDDEVCVCVRRQKWAIGDILFLERRLDQHEGARRAILDMRRTRRGIDSKYRTTGIQVACPDSASVAIIFCGLMNEAVTHTLGRRDCIHILSRICVMAVVV